MLLYITRHGETKWNALKIIQGRTDIELNETGRKQANQIKEELREVKIDILVTSPLKRAKETASIINEVHQLPIFMDERVIERGFGDLEGTSICNVDFTKFWRSEFEHLFPSSEKSSEFYQRINGFLEEIIQLPEDKNILVVAHGGVSLPFYSFFNGIPEGVDMRSYMLNNCEIACYDVTKWKKAQEVRNGKFRK